MEEATSAGFAAASPLFGHRAPFRGGRPIKKGFFRRFVGGHEGVLDAPRTGEHDRAPTLEANRERGIRRPPEHAEGLGGRRTGPRAMGLRGAWRHWLPGLAAWRFKACTSGYLQQASAARQEPCPLAECRSTPYRSAGGKPLSLGQPTR